MEDTGKVRQTQLLEQILMLEGELRNRDNKIRTLEGRLNAADDAYDQFTEEDWSRIDNLKKRLEEKETKCLGMEGQITALNGTIKAKEDSISEKLAEIVALNGTIKAKEDSISEKLGEIVALNGTIKAKEDSISGMLGEIVALNGTIKAREDSINRMLRQIMALNGTIVANEDLIGGMYHHIVSLNGTIKAGEERIAGMLDEIASLKGTIEENEVLMTKNKSKCIWSMVLVSAISMAFGYACSKHSSKKNNIVLQDGHLNPTCVEKTIVVQDTRGEEKGKECNGEGKWRASIWKAISNLLIY